MAHPIPNYSRETVEEDDGGVVMSTIAIDSDAVTVIETLPLQDHPIELVCSPSGQYLAYVRSGSLIVYDISSPSDLKLVYQTPLQYAFLTLCPSTLH